MQRAAFSGPAPENSLVIAPIQTDKFLVALAIHTLCGEYEPRPPSPRNDISETARVILDIGFSLAKILHTVIENGITDPEGKEQYPPRRTIRALPGHIPDIPLIAGCTWTCRVFFAGGILEDAGQKVRVP